MYKVKLDE